MKNFILVMELHRNKQRQFPTCHDSSSELMLLVDITIYTWVVTMYWTEVWS